jgi:hypothetical protein
MYGCLIVPPERTDSAFGAVFLHNEGYSTMCGHAVIALAKVVAECGMVAVENGRASLNIDVPCGQVVRWPNWKMVRWCAAGLKTLLLCRQRSAADSGQWYRRSAVPHCVWRRLLRICECG